MSGSVVPGFRYKDPARAVDWLCAAFGFERHLVVPGENGSVQHAQLTFGTGMIMLGPAGDDEYGRLMAQPAEIDGRVTQSAYVVVSDVDAHCAVATAAGAKIVMPPEDQPYGGRLYVCRDIESHLWNFGSYNPWA